MTALKSSLLPFSLFTTAMITIHQGKADLKMTHLVFRIP